MPSMTANEKLDIQRAAFSMIANHGRNAVDRAIERARNLFDEDAIEARMQWERIAHEIERIESRADKDRRIRA